MTAHVQANRADVIWNDEEVFLLQHIEQTWHQDFRMRSNTIADEEMACQRDMRVRGRRLWAYHEKLGDLWDIMWPGLSSILNGVPTSVHTLNGPHGMHAGASS